ncbi:helix-turn-helix domain-containing protein [Pseudonocardia kujensis]|nr:helix-turn-helix domain-containing protein [Pseudonocardia kujensis]
MFSGPDDRISLSDAVERLDLHKCTTHRYLVSLEQQGLLERIPGGGFVLGPLLRRVGAPAPPTPPIDVDADALLTLAKEAEETALLCRWSRHGPVVVHAEEVPAQKINISVAVGELLPLTSGPGLTFVAHQVNVAANHEARHELAEVRRVGVTVGAPLPNGLVVMASPVFGDSREVRAVLALIGTSTRLPQHHLAPQARLLRRAAAVLTHRTRELN